MAKSLRSKVKRDFRSKKREVGVYAAAEAGRLHRLNAKLVAVVSKDKGGDDEVLMNEPVDLDEVLVSEPSVVSNIPEGSRQPLFPFSPFSSSTDTNADSMQVDNSPASESSSSKRISTHGPRGSRREEWRLSKGLSAQPSRKGMNRQGGIGARRKAGRSKRRR
ncbi:hypothetical protein DFH05DRAFT_1528227 [Lentinula detonsa]|uniref:DUF2423 domain-containing protein n=1 Tax=Lentinula detonsa TaxID=2804962 RepID=A0A9W8NV08_9AGAR|nr:hypothetical protein DFH05DRAFT_1528227 [Lentinula detonsa]